MSPDIFGDRKLYAWLLGGALLAFVLLKLLACGSLGPTRTVAKVVRATVEAQCADLDPVVECLEKIDRNARLVDHALERDGGL